MTPSFVNVCVSEKTFRRLWQAALGFAALLPAVGRAETAPVDITVLAQEQFAFAAKQYAGMLKRLEGDETRQPRTLENGVFKAVKPEDWTSGFFPGSLWMIYEQTGEPEMLKAAENFTKRQESIQHFTRNHDVGFMLGCSYGEGLRITASQSYRDVLVQGARSLSTRFKTPPALIKSWEGNRWKYPVIVDNMMNLEILWFAHQQTGEAGFRDIALSHADKTDANHFRPDGSSFHLLDYSPETGEVIKRQTVQGLADDSAWARGQAWGLSGYVTMARLTGEKRYLERSRSIATFILNHPNLPADGVPYWDFNDPDIPNALRDASAGAIMAMAFQDLAELVPADEATRYRAMAEKQVRTLSSPAFRAQLNENGNFILMHSVGHRPSKSEVDVPLNYADYYFLKALSRYAKPAVKASGKY
jgi:unsaturated chondroitin disaccharide hydrolase